MPAPPQSSDAPSVTQGRRARERAKRVAKIREAATIVFGRRGYEGATMALIAAEAELGKASLYYYFPNKRALFADLLTSVTGALADAVEGAIAPGQDPFETVGIYLRQTVIIFARHPEFAAVHRRAASGGGEVLRALGGEAAAQAVARSHAHLGRALAEIGARLPPPLRPALPRVIASFLLGLGARVEASGPLGPGPSTSPSAFTQEIDLFVSALRALAESPGTSEAER